MRKKETSILARYTSSAGTGNTNVLTTHFNRILQTKRIQDQRMVCEVKLSTAIVLLFRIAERSHEHEHASQIMKAYLSVGLFHCPQVSIRSIGVYQLTSVSHLRSSSCADRTMSMSKPMSTGPSTTATTHNRNPAAIPKSSSSKNISNQSLDS